VELFFTVLARPRGGLGKTFSEGDGDEGRDL